MNLFSLVWSYLILKYRLTFVWEFRNLRKNLQVDFSVETEDRDAERVHARTSSVVFEVSSSSSSLSDHRKSSSWNIDWHWNGNFEVQERCCESISQRKQMVQHENELYLYYNCRCGGVGMFLDLASQRLPRFLQLTAQATCAVDGDVNVIKPREVP